MPIGMRWYSCTFFRVVPSMSRLPIQPDRCLNCMTAYLGSRTVNRSIQARRRGLITIPLGLAHAQFHFIPSSLRTRDNVQRGHPRRQVRLDPPTTYAHGHGIGFCGEKGFQHALQRFSNPHIGGVEARVYVWLINRCPGVSWNIYSTKQIAFLELFLWGF